MYIGRYLEPTLAEFQAALRQLVEAMEYSSILQQDLLAKDFKYGLIGDAAIMLYAQDLGLPWRQATQIEVIIQPNETTSVEEVTQILSTNKVFTDLGFTKHARSTALQISIKRGNKDVPVVVKIVDHYVWPQHREYYDLELSENERTMFPLGDEKLPVLSAQWILRRLVREWNECDDYELKEEITIKMKTMCDVLSLKRKKLLMRSKKDIHEMRNLRDGFEDDISVLSTVIDCPEVLGPWYNLPWVRRLLFVVFIIVGSVICDYYVSREIEDPEHMQLRANHSSLRTQARSKIPSITPIFSRIEDAERQLLRTTERGEL